eukprot:5359939-Prymnesium_polylepis.1
MPAQDASQHSDNAVFDGSGCDACADGGRIRHDVARPRGSWTIRKCAFGSLLETASPSSQGTRHAADVHRCTPKMRHNPPPCHGA